MEPMGTGQGSLAAMLGTCIFSRSRCKLILPSKDMSKSRLAGTLPVVLPHAYPMPKLQRKKSVVLEVLKTSEWTYIPENVSGGADAFPCSGISGL
jgi:hypothetical protein